MIKQPCSCQRKQSQTRLSTVEVVEIAANANKTFRLGENDHRETEDVEEEDESVVVVAVLVVGTFFDRTVFTKVRPDLAH